MARRFVRASSEYIQNAIGAFDFTGSGGVSFAALVYFDSTTVSQCVIDLSTSGGTGRIRFGTGTGAKVQLTSATASVGATATVTGKWLLIAATKAGGTATPRLHHLDVAAGTWAHEAGSVTVADFITPGTTGKVQLGRSRTGFDYFDGRIALVAAWKRELTDAEIEQLAGGFRAWLAQRPDGLWPLNQGAVADGVVDWSGGGAHQAAISGTTVSAEHPARWRWGGTVQRAQSVPAVGTYTGTAAVALPVMTAAGAGTFTAPVYTGTAAIGLPPATASGTGTHTAPTYTGTATPSLPPLTASGTGTFAAPVYTGSAAVTLPVATASGSGVFTAPVYTGSAAVVGPALTATGGGTFAVPVYSGAGAGVLPAVTVAGVGVATAPTWTGTAALTLAALTASGAGTFVLAVPQVPGRVTLSASVVGGVAALSATVVGGATVGATRVGGTLVITTEE